MKADRGRWRAAGSGRFREDAAGFRARLAVRSAEPDPAFVNPWAECAERRDWRAMLLASARVQMFLHLAASFAATAAVVTLLGVFGPGIVDAMISVSPDP